MKVEKIK